MHITHPFVSGKADGTDATLVKPTNWNADHKIITDADAVVLGRAAGAGPGAVQELTFGSFLPSGVVMMTAGAAAPTGWLICDGALLLRSDYTQLFTVIGTAYDTTVDANHFRVPNMQGRVAAGVDPTGSRLTGATITPNGATLGGVGGAETAGFHLPAIGVNVGQSYPGGGFFGNVIGAQSVNITSYGESHGTGNVAFGGSGYFADSHNHVVQGNTGGERIYLEKFGATGGTNAYDSSVVAVQPTLLLNYIIKT